MKTLIFSALMIVFPLSTGFASVQSKGQSEDGSIRIIREVRR
jgi:hypothetical protein